MTLMLVRLCQNVAEQGEVRGGGAECIDPEVVYCSFNEHGLPNVTGIVNLKYCRLIMFIFYYLSCYIQTYMLDKPSV